MFSDAYSDALVWHGACATCGVSFDPSVSIGTPKVYCSQSCRLKARRKRRLLRDTPTVPAPVVDELPKRRGRKPNVDLRRRKYEFVQVRPHIMERDAHACVCCGDRATQVHHIVPLSHGGGNSPDNLIALCGACHVGFHPYLSPRITATLLNL